MWLPPRGQSGHCISWRACGGGYCSAHGLGSLKTGGVAGGEQGPPPFLSWVRTPGFAEYQSYHGTALRCHRPRCGCCPGFTHESAREVGTCSVTWPAGIEKRLTVRFPASGCLLESMRKTGTGTCSVARPGPLVTGWGVAGRWAAQPCALAAMPSTV